jgi:antitoxin (DNA-binding transcriptional repressor) of toxin-antitoxin stability system
LELLIYEEAWDLEERGVALQRRSDSDSLMGTYASKEAFLRDVPRLIIEHNIHGVDIDPRAVQIAGLSLWLRSQRSWQAQGLKPSERPQIRKSNIVCAEPMPGEEQLLDEFIEQHLADMPEQRLVGQLVRRVFEAMKLAGEAGSLLQIEQKISRDIEEAKLQWLNRPKSEQLALLTVGAEPNQQELPLLIGKITDEFFWERIEGEIYKALNHYAEQADLSPQEGNSYQRRLFANDAVRGFAFVDLCRKKFDVVLMNPPFGSAPESIEVFLDVNKITDIDALFTIFAVEQLIPHGLVGMITNRTQLLKPALSDFRRLTLTERSKIEICVDLGNGVLDAMVETAAFTSRKSSNIKPSYSSFFSCLKSQNKFLCMQNITSDTSSARLINCESFSELPDTRFAYWLHPSFIYLLQPKKQIINDQYVAFGLSTTDNFRFLRLFWEISPELIKPYVPHTSISAWVPLAKGGEYSPYFGDIHLLVDWRESGAGLRAQPGAPIRNEHLYGKPGLTYTKRTASAFAPRVLPAGCIPEVNGTVILPRSSDSHDSISVLAVTMSRVVSYLTDILVAAGDTSFAYGAAKDYIPGVVGKLPIPHSVPELCCSATQRIVEIKRILESQDETSIDFSIPPTLLFTGSSRFNDLSKVQIESMILASKLAAESDEALEASVFSLPQDAVDELTYAVGPLVGRLNSQTVDSKAFSDCLSKNSETIVSECLASGRTRKDISKNSYRIDRRLELLASLFEVDVSVCGEALLKEYSQPEQRTKGEVSFFLGVTLGRWDVRFVIKNNLIPALCDPFAIYPRCPRGMLSAPDGLPATSGKIVSEEWLLSRPYANLLPPEGTVKNPFIQDSEYPVQVAWSGIVVDDEGHPNDIIRHIREVFKVIWGEKDSDIEQETCGILKVNNLREYFRKPAAFFNDHLNRYSKSRRQAPLYLPLSTRSGSYTLWLYYHRLTDQTLYTCINDYLEPKLSRTSETVTSLRSKPDRSRNEEKNLEDLQTLETELLELRDELLRVAQLPWKPNLNDDVQITVAPLYSLFRLSKWQKKLKETWDKLEKGDYDWAHLAHTIWTARVRQKCRTDKSLAIAHNLEDLYAPPRNPQTHQTQEKGAVTMKTKQYDLLSHSTDLNELLAEITADTEIVITRGDTPIARLLPTDDVLLQTSSGTTIAFQAKTGANGTSPATKPRKPNLHPGGFVMSDDFDDPLPDSFWLGEEE